MKEWYLENEIYLKIKQNASKQSMGQRGKHREIIKYLNWVKTETQDTKICGTKLNQCLGKKER